jgi:hypothetical protein
VKDERPALSWLMYTSLFVIRHNFQEEWCLDSAVSRQFPVNEGKNIKGNLASFTNNKTAVVQVNPKVDASGTSKDYV